MKTILSGSGVLLIALSCLAADLTNNAGKVFSNAKVIRVEPDGLNISHAGGIAKLYFWELPESVQKQYGYDPTNAVAYRKQVTAAQQGYQQKHLDTDVRVTQAQEQAKQQEASSNAQRRLYQESTNYVDEDGVTHHRHFPVDRITEMGGQMGSRPPQPPP